VDAKKCSQEGTSLELLLVGERVQLESESYDTTYVPAQWTKFKRLTPTVPSAQLQHTHPSTMDRKQRSQEGTSLKLNIVGEIVTLEPAVSFILVVSANTTNNKGLAPTVPTSHLQHNYPSTVVAKKGS
jgi:hypothetical protein